MPINIIVINHCKKNFLLMFQEYYATSFLSVQDGIRAANKMTQLEIQAVAHHIYDHLVTTLADKVEEPRNCKGM